MGSDQTLTGQYCVLPGVILTIEPSVTVSPEYHNNDIDKVGARVLLPADDINFDTPKVSDEINLEEHLIILLYLLLRKQQEIGVVFHAGEAINNIEKGGKGEVEGLPDAIP